MLLLGADTFCRLASDPPLHRPVARTAYSIEEDRSFVEFLQFAEQASVLGLLGLLAVRRRAPAYIGWIALFGYLLLDDAFMVHECLGAALSCS